MEPALIIVAAVFFVAFIIVLGMFVVIRRKVLRHSMEIAKIEGDEYEARLRLVSECEDLREEWESLREESEDKICKYVEVKKHLQDLLSQCQTDLGVAEAAIEKSRLDEIRLRNDRDMLSKRIQTGNTDVHIQLAEFLHVVADDLKVYMDKEFQSRGEATAVKQAMEKVMEKHFWPFTNEVTKEIQRQSKTIRDIKEASGRDEPREFKMTSVAQAKSDQGSTPAGSMEEVKLSVFKWHKGNNIKFIVPENQAWEFRTTGPNNEPDPIHEMKSGTVVGYYKNTDYRRIK